MSRCKQLDKHAAVVQAAVQSGDQEAVQEALEATEKWRATLLAEIAYMAEQTRARRQSLNTLDSQREALRLLSAVNQERASKRA